MTVHRIHIERTDITTLVVDAIVNAANEAMLGGGGVDGAIHQAAGPELLAECESMPEVRPGVRCPTGQACITAAYKLPVRHVIHTVGPVYRDGLSGEPAALAACYRNCMKIAAKHELRSIAFPAISCGVFGYPPSDAAQIAIRETREFLASDNSLQSVVLVAFGSETEGSLREALATSHDS